MVAYGLIVKDAYTNCRKDVTYQETHRMKYGSMAWAIIDLVFAVVNLAIWLTRDAE